MARGVGLSFSSFAALERLAAVYNTQEERGWVGLGHTPSRSDLFRIHRQLVGFEDF